MSRATLLTAITLFSLLLIAGCSEDEDDPGGASGGKPPAAMVGTWIFQSVTVDGGAASLATVMEWQPNSVEARLHIQANGAYVVEEVNAMGGQLWFESGFVFVDGGEMDINVQQDSDGPVDETSMVTFTLNAGTMTITENDGGTIVVFTLAKDV